MLRSCGSDSGGGGGGGGGGGDDGVGFGGGSGVLHHGPLSTYEPSAEDLQQPETPEPDSIPVWIAGWSKSAGEATAQLIWRLTDSLSTQVSDLDENGVRELTQFILTFELPGIEEGDIKQHIDARREGFVSEKVRGELGMAEADAYRQSERASEAAAERQRQQQSEVTSGAHVTSKPLPAGASSSGLWGDSKKVWDEAEEELRGAGVGNQRARMGREAAEAMAEDFNKKAKMGDLDPAPGDMDIFK